MKRLIINADDLGADEARNEGIFQAIEAGVITSVSILPNGPALKDALSRIRSRKSPISCGMHFNLSEGQPVSSGLRILTGPDGCFRGKKFIHALLAGAATPELENEIRTEMAAQVKILRNAGLRIDHLNGHQHVHIFPAAVRPVMHAAKAYGIPWIRVPEEQPGEFTAESLSPGALEEAQLFSSHAKAARLFLHSAGICTTDQFKGLYFKGRLPASNWVKFINNLPDGVTELMVHPGLPAADPNAGPFSRFSTLERLRELQALTDGLLSDALIETGIKLTHCPEVPI